MTIPLHLALLSYAVCLGTAVATIRAATTATVSGSHDARFWIAFALQCARGPAAGLLAATGAMMLILAMPGANAVAVFAVTLLLLASLSYLASRYLFREEKEA